MKPLAARALRASLGGSEHGSTSDASRIGPSTKWEEFRRRFRGKFNRTNNFGSLLARRDLRPSRSIFWAHRRRLIQISDVRLGQGGIT